MKTEETGNPKPKEDQGSVEFAECSRDADAARIRAEIGDKFGEARMLLGGWVFLRFQFQKALGGWVVSMVFKTRRL